MTSSRIDHLKTSRPLILPSLLQCDFGNLEREVESLCAAGTSALHLDVMDGQFVPNLTYGMPIVAGLRGLTNEPLDVHLMIERPERYLSQFRDAGSDLLTVHVEACSEPAEVLRQIGELGMGSGIAINPSTPIEKLAGVMEEADLILVMSVEAGFGGQSFNENAIERLQWVNERKRADQMIEVDGGIAASTIGRCHEAGAELFVVGSAIFRESDYGPVVRSLTECLAGAES